MNNLFTTTRQTKNGNILFANQNGQSTWWKQEDTDTMFSPIHRAYKFYIHATQDLDTKEWTFTVYNTETKKQMGKPLNEDGITTPQQAKEWYKKQ